ncbi:MAG TPA: L,D-transpeptidase [Gemmatimonadaceae bacterium]|nr:L,D-transpeptidase [Gemmatimonadaceae bacterium]
MNRLRARVRTFAVVACIAALPVPAALRAQESASLASRAPAVGSDSPPLESAPPTRADSLAAHAARAAASVDAGLRILVSIADRRLLVLDGNDTLMSASAAVGMDRRLTYEGRSWTFRPPRGIRVVEGKSARDAWIPPDWHYAEVAREYRLRLARLPADSEVVLDDGTVLAVRDGQAGLVRPDGSFSALPVGEEIVFDSTLYIPPLATENRSVYGELGEYQLDLGGGYLIHGTPRKGSIGTATTHGCVRLDDAQIEWLYRHIPTGTPVYIY